MQSGVVNLYRDSQLDIETLHGYFVGQAFSRHMHDYYVIGLIHKGLQTFRYRGNTRYVTPPGGLLFLNPGEAHTGEAANEEGFEYYALYPRVAPVRAIVSDITGRDNELPLFNNVRVDDAALAKQLRELHICLRNNRAPLQSESMLICLISSMVKKYADIRLTELRFGKENRAIETAKAYIQGNLAKSITLTDLAHATGFSRYYFLRLFTHVMGMSPHTYLESVRLMQAKELIKQGLGLRDIAYATGFSDQSHFTNRFKQYLGITPGLYAKGVQ